VATHGEVGEALATEYKDMSPLPVGTDARHDPRQEPDAVTPHVRICEGGSPQGLSLPRPIRREAARLCPLILCALVLWMMVYHDDVARAKISKVSGDDVAKQAPAMMGTRLVRRRLLKTFEILAHVRRV
jgi:hypothetical protein